MAFRRHGDACVMGLSGGSGHDPVLRLPFKMTVWLVSSCL